MIDLSSLPALEVRNANKMSQEELEMVDRAELADLGKVQAWTSEGNNKQLAYSTHGMIRFFGKFPPPIASYLIESYTKEGDLVLDPMSGSGTSGVESLLRHRKSELRDVNPLMLMLARVKTTKLPLKAIEEEFSRIKNSYKPISFKKEKDNFSGLRDPEHWFLPATMNSLLGIKVLIDQIEDGKLKEYFLICFAGIIRRVSRATTQQGRLFLDVDTAVEDAMPFFEKKIRDTKASVSGLPNKKYRPKIIQANLQEPINNTSDVDLVILHPPYFNSYKYSSVNSLELFWLGVNHADIRKHEVREFFKVGKPENHTKFVSDMSKALENAYQRLRPGGRIGFMMGDTAIRGEYIPVIRKTLDSANLPKHKIETVALRVPKYTEASWAASQRRKSGEVGIKIFDFVVVIKKNA